MLKSPKSNNANKRVYRGKGKKKREQRGTRGNRGEETKKNSHQKRKGVGQWQKTFGGVKDRGIAESFKGQRFSRKKMWEKIRVNMVSELHQEGSKYMRGGGSVGGVGKNQNSGQIISMGGVP